MYSQLILEERFRLRGSMKMGLAKTETAHLLDRLRSAIDRELGENRNVDGNRLDTAVPGAWERWFRDSKTKRSTRPCVHIEYRLAMGRSGDNGRSAAA